MNLFEPETTRPGAGWSPVPPGLETKIHLVPPPKGRETSPGGGWSPVPEGTGDSFTLQIYCFKEISLEAFPEGNASGRRPEAVLILEQYLFHILKPEYNISKIAGSIAGHKFPKEFEEKQSVINLATPGSWSCIQPIGWKLFLKKCIAPPGRSSRRSLVHRGFTSKLRA